jgi:hypothetical protein
MRAAAILWLFNCKTQEVVILVAIAHQGFETLVMSGTLRPPEVATRPKPTVPQGFGSTHYRAPTGRSKTQGERRQGDDDDDDRDHDDDNGGSPRTQEKTGGDTTTTTTTRTTTTDAKVPPTAHVAVGKEAGEHVRAGNA